jgi:hypothetical protein
MIPGILSAISENVYNFQHTLLPALKSLLAVAKLSELIDVVAHVFIHISLFVLHSSHFQLLGCH